MSAPRKHYASAVVGDWHLAFVTAACLSRLGHRTALVATKPRGASNFPDIPVHEPGLRDLILDGQSAGTLNYEDADFSGWSADYVWLAIDTPVDEQDRVNTAALDEVIIQLREFGNVGRVLVVTSQVPLGFCRAVEKFGFRVAYVPENLRLGHGIQTFLKADRFIVGAETAATSDEVAALLKPTGSELFLTNLPTAEMTKHALNAFLATSISFANELAAIGARYDVDVHQVAQSLKLDKRIGAAAYVAPGLGFAGGTLPRDLRVLQSLAQASGARVPLLDAVLEVNERTLGVLVESCENYLGTLSGKALLIVGYTYKADTDTLRRSMSLDLAKELKARGAVIYGYDPALNHCASEVGGHGIQHVDSWNQLPSSVKMAIVMTARPNFKELAWEKLRPALVLDPHGFLDANALLASGLFYKAMWQPIRRGKSE